MGRRRRRGTYIPKGLCGNQSVAVDARARPVARAVANGTPGEAARRFDSNPHVADAKNTNRKEPVSPQVVF